MKKSKLPAVIQITLSNGESTEIYWTSMTMAQQHLNEIKAKGILLGSWIKDIKLIDTDAKLS
jgi:hypothetical protein